MSRSINDRSVIAGRGPGPDLRTLPPPPEKQNQHPRPSCGPPGHTKGMTFSFKVCRDCQPSAPLPNSDIPTLHSPGKRKHFQGPLNNNPALVWMVNVGELTRPDSMGSLLRISSMELMVLLGHSWPLATGRTGGGLCPTWWSQLERDWGSVCRFSAKVSGSVI